MKIFEDGLLKSEFLNLDYKSTAPLGWSCSVGDGEVYGTWFLPCIANGVPVVTSVQGVRIYQDQDSISIQEFTVDDIEAGELVWIKFEDVWYLTTLDCVSKDRGGVFFMDAVEKYYLEDSPMVPYLIAGNKETAESLKDWWK